MSAITVSPGQTTIVKKITVGTPVKRVAEATDNIVVSHNKKIRLKWILLKWILKVAHDWAKTRETNKTWWYQATMIVNEYVNKYTTDWSSKMS